MFMFKSLAGMILALLFVAGCSIDQAGNASSSEMSREDSDLFVEGNLFFIAYHELGHALVSELDIPIAGKEEDAVDRLATWLLTPEDDEESPDYLIQSIDGWFQSANDVKPDDIEWWDEHGTDEQRAFQIACLLYGSKPDRYKSVADDVDLPAERRESCVDEAEQNEDSWSRLLDEHWLEDGKDSQKPSTKLVYRNTKKFAKQRTYLQNIELLEEIATVLNEDFTLPPGIIVEASECDGESNAFWDPEDRKLKICYELVTDYQAMAVSD
ncbi:DUF4344 domain-containing metallopeptidase [Parasphingorhabdus halotolerans]|uniref:Metallopeptidase n=1 Tax=Parasphingorhabdus halotolerans TaxID=2725558 RepID=A0A6H2DIJ6_9SPHN|nr:DUF4344 domain-containing metallopeptidase [Parasphingorhabdus halotolerans]QJB68154.1 hypothetical protein HF685_01585 [Parasphingorhabdus halotolerans]